jgi:hypothetical protein
LCNSIRLSASACAQSRGTLTGDHQLPAYVRYCCDAEFIDQKTCSAPNARGAKQGDAPSWRGKRLRGIAWRSAYGIFAKGSVWKRRAEEKAGTSNLSGTISANENRIEHLHYEESGNGRTNAQ